MHLVQQREPLSKRVMLSMAVVAPLATHAFARGLGLEEIFLNVHIYDVTALAQGVCLCLVLALLLRLRRYRWRRIRPERVRRPSGSLSSAASPGTRSPRAQRQLDRWLGRAQARSSRARAPSLASSAQIA